MLLSRVLVLLSTFAAGLVIARQLGPEGLGVLGYLLVPPTLVMILAEAGIRQSLGHLLGQRLVSDGALLGTGLAVVAVGSLVGMLACVAGFVVLGGAGLPRSGIALAVVLIPLRLIAALGGGMLLGRERLREFNRVTWLSSAVYFAGVCLLASLGRLSVVGALSMMVLGGGCAGAYAMGAVFRQDVQRLAISGPVASRLLSYGLLQALALLLIQINYRVDLLILGQLRSPAELGQYALGVSLVERLWEVPAALGVVVFARSAKALDADQFSREVARVLRTALAVTCGAGLALFSLVGVLLPLLYGEVFRPAVEVVRLLIPGVVAFTVVKILNTDLSGRGRPDIAILVMLPAVVVNVVLNLLWIPNLGASGAALASLVSYLLAGLGFLVTYGRLTKLGVRELLGVRASDFSFLARIPARVWKRT